MGRRRGAKRYQTRDSREALACVFLHFFAHATTHPSLRVRLGARGRRIQQVEHGLQRHDNQLERREHGQFEHRVGGARGSSDSLEVRSRGQRPESARLEHVHGDEAQPRVARRSASEGVREAVQAEHDQEHGKQTLGLGSGVGGSEQTRRRTSCNVSRKK
jgi:hypothetical protein